MLPAYLAERIPREGWKVITSGSCYLEERKAMSTMVRERKDDSESQLEQIRVQYF